MSTDLEDRLRRGLQATADDVAPAPRDLADVVRHRARRQRRTRLAVGAAGLVAALVFVGVPVVASTLVADSGSRTATPAERPRLDPLPTLLDAPTRGSLADDEEWLAGVRALSWSPTDVVDRPAEVGLPDPAVADRRVAFAGDVPGGRAALVVAPEGDIGVVGAWYTGPEGARPAEMTLATAPSRFPRSEPAVLWDATSGDRVVLLLVGLPGTEARYLAGREVTAEGEERRLWEPVPLVDGAGAVEVTQGTSPGVPGPVVLEYTWGGRTGNPTTAWYADPLPSSPPELAVADPRGLRDAVPGDLVQMAATTVLGHYGTGATGATPTLLAAGSVEGTTTVLVGATLPSGATTTALLTSRTIAGPPDAGTSTTLSFGQAAPAGTALLERVVAAAGEQTLTVSAPSAGAVAEVYLADGTLLTTIPLVDGAGSGALPPSAPERVRVLDAAGALVGEAPLTEPAG